MPNPGNPAGHHRRGGVRDHHRDQGPEKAVQAAVRAAQRGQVQAGLSRSDYSKGISLTEEQAESIESVRIVVPQKIRNQSSGSRQCQDQSVER